MDNINVFIPPTTPRVVPGAITCSVDELLLIHSAIHKGKGIKLADGTVIPVVKVTKGLRQLTYNNILFIEQNPNKDTVYAELARAGHQITWGIREGEWIKIIDGTVYVK